MIRLLLLTCVIAGPNYACAMSVRATGHCPRLPHQVVDFVAAGVALAGSVNEYNEHYGHWTPLGFGLLASGMALALASNLSECHR